mmetsp:Transcript_27670/g.42578  ORF Transcript_27670/g.42578 Transcript_27670/m.42578 type:complete len:543 (+) Transcript_27670:98-1726(+)
MSMFDGLNEAVAGSFIGKYFEFEERGAKFTTEVSGAIATFLSMAYILAVNPRILADSGGPCNPADWEDTGGIFSDGYVGCMEDVKRQYVSATAIASMFGCLLMGLGANLPIALAPGMGMNAYFTYTVVGWRGTGGVSFDAAMTAVLIEGGIFLILAVTGIRYAIVKLIPEPVRLATPAAIGAFLAHLGFQTAEGIGVVVSDIATAVTLGGCPDSKRVPIVALTESCAADSNFCVTSDAYTCDDLGGIMASGKTWIGILGLGIMTVMLCYKQKSAFLIGIGFVTVMSWIRGTGITYFPDDPAGNSRFEYFQKVVSIESLDLVSLNYTGDLKNAGLALFTFLYVDFLDTSGTLMALVSAMGFVDEDGSFPKARQAFAVDAISTMFGSLFGLSPVTSYIESAAGVEAGSRTGLTSVICAFFFFLSIFFSPILASIPPWATGGALILVGSLMARSLAKVQWHNISHAITAFVTLMLMPLTYSIAYGLIAGIGAFIFLEGTFFLLSLVGIEKPTYDLPIDTPVKKIEEPEEEEEEEEEEVEEAPETK